MELSEENISLIINGSFALGGVIIGGIMNFLLTSFGKVIFLENSLKLICYKNEEVSKQFEDEVICKIEESSKINLLCNIDIHNTSKVRKSIRNIKIETPQAKILLIKDRNTDDKFGYGNNYDYYNVINLSPGETKTLNGLAYTSKEDFNLNKPLFVKILYRKGNGKRIIKKKFMIKYNR